MVVSERCPSTSARRAGTIRTAAARGTASSIRRAGRSGFDELAYYAEHFDTVEVNSTFYRMPVTGPMSARWLRAHAVVVRVLREALPEVHASGHVSASGRRVGLDVTPGDLDQFRDGIDPHRARPDDWRRCSCSSRRAFTPRRRRSRLPGLAARRRSSGYPLAVELRHRSWSDARGRHATVLAAHRAAWVRIDEPKFEDSIAQDFSVGCRSHAPLVLRAAPRPERRQLVDARRTPRIGTTICTDPRSCGRSPTPRRQASAAGRRVVMYLNNHFSAKAVANAAVLKHQLGDLIPGDYPREMLDRYPDLSGIVATSGLPL